MTNHLDDMMRDDLLEHAAEQQQEAAAQRGRDLAQDLWNTAAAMNKAAASMYAPAVCDHCRGAGIVHDYQNGGAKPCYACSGTGGPRTSKMAYNRHRG